MTDFFFLVWYTQVHGESRVFDSNYVNFKSNYLYYDNGSVNFKDINGNLHNWYFYI